MTLRPCMSYSIPLPKRRKEELFTNRVWQQARRLVKDEWNGIEAVADALIARKTLSGKEVGKIAGSERKIPK